MAIDSFEEFLTPRERQVVELIVEGYSAKEIGKMLSISPRTVEAHRWNICRKLRARNTADIVRMALEARMARQAQSIQSEQSGQPGQSGKTGQLRFTRPAHSEKPLKEGEGLTFINLSEIDWQEIAPGVAVKILFLDKKRKYLTKLVRMEAGACYPRHLHFDTEELFMLEGDFQVAGRSLAPGDYHRAENRSIHAKTSTRSGCKFLLLSSTSDILFD